MEQNDVMQEMLKTQKKTLFHARLRTLLAILCAAVLIFGTLMILRSLRTVPAELSDVLGETKQTMISAREALERSKEVDIDAVNDALTTFPGSIRTPSTIFSCASTTSWSSWTV